MPGKFVVDKNVVRSKHVSWKSNSNFRVRPQGKTLVLVKNLSLNVPQTHFNAQTSFVFGFCGYIFTHLCCELQRWQMDVLNCDSAHEIQL